MMELPNPADYSAETQYVTPECSSRYSLISSSIGDSGYSSVLSSGVSAKTIRASSLSPPDVRKRLFDTAHSSYTPEISREARVSRRRSGRCLISTSVLEEETGSYHSVPSNENASVVYGFSTPTKSFPRKLASTPSPKKHHPYSRDDAVVTLTKSNHVYKQKTRTPPRRDRTSSPVSIFPAFSELPVYRDPYRPRFGSQYVDFLWCLGRERMMAPALSLVLSHLTGEDLIVCSIVSKTWQSLVMSDKSANSRRLDAIEKRKVKKENIVHASMKDKVNILKENRSALGVIQQDKLYPPENIILKTPPPKMSPKSYRFQLFMKEGLRVDGNESQHLKPCPHCSFPSLVDTKLNLGVCSRRGCQFRFCTLCYCSEHLEPINSMSSSPPRYIVCPFAPKATTPPSPPQPTLFATRRKLDLASSKRSKRNLRRL